MSLGLTLTRMPTATQPGLMVRVFTRVCDFLSAFKTVQMSYEPISCVCAFTGYIHTFDA